MAEKEILLGKFRRVWENLRVPVELLVLSGLSFKKARSRAELYIDWPSSTAILYRDLI